MFNFAVVLLPGEIIYDDGESTRACVSVHIAMLQSCVVNCLRQILSEGVH